MDQLQEDKQVKDQDIQTYLTSKETAARLRCGTGHLANQRSQRQGLPYYKFGVSVVYRADEVEAYIATCRVEVAA